MEGLITQFYQIHAINGLWSARCALGLLSPSPYHTFASGVGYCLVSNANAIACAFHSSVVSRVVYNGEGSLY